MLEKSKSKGASKELIRKLNKKVGIINKLISVQEKNLDGERHLYNTTQHNTTQWTTK